MRILITGGAGFIGSHLAEALVKKGHHVVVFDNLSTGFQANLAGIREDIEFVHGDIRDRLALDRVVSGCEAIFHQGALPSVPRSIDDPALCHEINLNGTLNVLLAARGANCERVVLAASSSFYGDTEILPKIESMGERVKSPYALTKFASEIYFRLFAELYGMKTLSLRYFNVFGPRQDPANEYSAVIPKFLQSMLAGRAPTIFGDGSQSRDFTYVENAVHANLLALECPSLAGQSVNVGCGESFTLLQLLDSLNRELGTQFTPTFLPERVGDVRHSIAAIDQARELLGYRPVVGFSEGIRRTVHHFRGACF